VRCGGLGVGTKFIKNVELEIGHHDDRSLTVLAGNNFVIGDYNKLGESVNENNIKNGLCEWVRSMS
jgi:hypothetical protein